MPNPVRPLQCAQTLAHRQPAYGVSPTRPPDRGTCTLEAPTADCASHANAPWDELRVWDPGRRGTREGGEETRGR